jgi:SAM-dependent methyltransferase
MDTLLNHEISAPSEWVLRFADRVPTKGSVLDVACGSGRHSRLFASLGHPVDAVDRDAAAFTDIPEGVNFVAADIETGEEGAWPFAGRHYGGVIVTNYLFRPLLSMMVDAVAPGGILIYETFAKGNERFGKPSNPDFLLRHGELIDAVKGRLRVIAYEDIHTETPKPAMVQRIAAVR